MKHFILLFCFLSLNSFAQITKDTLKMESYSIAIPEGWDVKEDCEEADCTLLSPNEDYEDTFLENINITLAKAPTKDFQVKKYTDFSIGYLPSVVDDFKLIERKELENNTEFIIYQGIKSEFNQIWKQYYYIKGDGLYIITFSAEAHKFEDYIEKIQPVLDSFTILKK